MIGHDHVKNSWLCNPKEIPFSTDYVKILGNKQALQKVLNESKQDDLVEFDFYICTGANLRS